MENNNINTKYLATNLLNTREFLSNLQFEANYANTVKGGHLPYYYSSEKKRRLVSDINFLSSDEQQEIVYNLFTSKN